MNTIVDYSSSSDDEIESTSLEPRLQSMPKLPSFFGEAKETIDIGKKRTVPHKKDSWATYVYFQVDLTDEKILKFCKGLEVIEEQHISLSRTIYLKYFQLESFVLSVQKAVEDICSFYISFAQVAYLTNDEKTRSFLTLEVGNGYNELKNCLGQIDKVMQMYKQPTFYNPPRFHTSIAWSLDESRVKSIDIPQDCLDTIIQKSFMLTRIYIKQGHIIKHIDLK